MTNQPDDRSQSRSLLRTVRSPNAQYSLATPNSLAMRLARIQRRKMYEAFLSLGPGGNDTILDVGATSDQSYDHSNYLEAWYPEKGTITAVGIDRDARIIEQLYPGVRFVLADGRALPYPDNSFDFVHSSAVLEHVGSRSQQAQFISEASRVARKGVFITTPNRWFPVEFHTVLPFVHWLPQAQFRSLLRSTGRDFFAIEENLNLLDTRDLRTICDGLRLAGRYRIESVRLAGFTSNLLLIVQSPLGR